MGLTAAEIEQWNRDGYVICRGALQPEDIAPMVADYEQIVEEMAQQLHAGLANSQAVNADKREAADQHRHRDNIAVEHQLQRRQIAENDARSDRHRRKGGNGTGHPGRCLEGVVSHIRALQKKS